MNEDLDAMLFQLICSTEQEAVVATSSSKFFTMNDNTTQSLDRPQIKRKPLLDTRQTMTKTLRSRNNVTLFTRPYLHVSLLCFYF